MANIGPKGILRHMDDPSVTVMNASSAAGKTWVSAGDSGDTTFARAVAAGKGLHYKGILAATNANMLEFASNNLMFVAQEGHCEVEMLLQFSTVADIGFCFGFNDQILETANSVPMAIGTTTVSANSASFVGFTFDTDADNDVLHCTWVDDGNVGQTDANGRVQGELIKMSSIAPIASKWLYMRVELDDMGSGNKARATFLAVDHRGRSEERTFNTTLDRDVPLAYYLGVQNAAATLHSIYIHNCNWAQTIPDM